MEARRPRRPGRPGRPGGRGGRGGRGGPEAPEADGLIRLVSTSGSAENLRLGTIKLTREAIDIAGGAIIIGAAKKATINPRANNYNDPNDVGLLGCLSRDRGHGPIRTIHCGHVIKTKSFETTGQLVAEKRRGGSRVIRRTRRTYRSRTANSTCIASATSQAHPRGR